MYVVDYAVPDSIWYCSSNGIIGNTAIVSREEILKDIFGKGESWAKKLVYAAELWRCIKPRRRSFVVQLHIGSLWQESNDFMIELLLLSWLLYLCRNIALTIPIGSYLSDT